MRLTKTALESIVINSPGAKSKLALALNCSEQSINKYIRENSDNLTKAAALQVIREVTGLTDAEILVEEETIQAGE
jgi:hypothetical protein